MQLARSLPLLTYLLLAPGLASAHALVVYSRPGADQIVAGDAVDVEVRFNSRIDAERSSLKLFGPGESAVVMNKRDASYDALRASVAGLAPGLYRLHWQTLSLDGHISQGDIAFEVRR